MRVKALILVPLVAVALTACAAQVTPVPTTTEAVTEKPLFATDEEALSAAQAAYANYLEVSDQIARDGGVNPERLKSLVSSDLYKEQADAYSSLVSSGNYAGGSSTFDHFRVQQTNGDMGNGTITAYLCLDVSNNPMLSSEGIDVTPVGRQPRIPLEILFAYNNSKQLEIESSDVWAGTNFC